MTPVNGSFYVYAAFSEIYSTIEDLYQIKSYRSNFSCIQDAINIIPSSLELDNVLGVIVNFNNRLADYKNAVGYCQNIFTLEQLRHLEQQLMVYKLIELRGHFSAFESIKIAIATISYPIEACNVLDVIEEFNRRLAECKNAVGYYENIFTLEQLDYLEQQLTVYKLIELRGHFSAFESIKTAIATIPHPIVPRNVLDVIGDFNRQLVECKNAVGYHESIFTLEQLRHLEQQLTVYKLIELRGHFSAFESIKTAIATIPHPIVSCNVLDVIGDFNRRLAECKNAVGYHESIFTLEQLGYLEQRLIMYKLIELKERNLSMV